MNADLIHVVIITAICFVVLGGVGGYAIGWTHGYREAEHDTTR